ncbi:hypothetical protein PCANC_25960 [Puccinia coronata f. sp. avenae]|uniref:Uncharacterized protein n=1 Tax=Puccinia coronata f. sp. avenae TaxID=200324 RepID=A0A2N5RYE4_9BASI|nr:hypothetical protein PCANC_27400 [Puccinia coronata f. sp. avenae]PLW24943.1 hypothetical protein PCANC_25960 [Puccinia coronata f. sp. avenae]
MAHNLCYTTLTDTKMAKFPTHHLDALTMPPLRHRHGPVTKMWSSSSMLSPLTTRSSSTGSSSSSTHNPRWKRSYTITAKQSSSGAGLANHHHHHRHHHLHLHEQPGDAL